MAELINMRKAYGEALVDLGAAQPERGRAQRGCIQLRFQLYVPGKAFPSAFSMWALPSSPWWMWPPGWPTAEKSPLPIPLPFCLPRGRLEMVRTHLCYGEANVKLMAAYAGISDSFDGPTHHSITDIAIMRSLPNMTVVVPADTIAVAKLLPQVAEWKGPVYFRLNRNEVPRLFDDTYAPRDRQGRARRAREAI